jgi:hypothetical protein
MGPIWFAPRANAQQSEEAAARAAVTHMSSATNDHIRLYAWELERARWPQPTIFVCWENPSPQYSHEMDIVRQEVADTWEKVSQLRFLGWQQCAQNNRGIRILIDDSGPHTQGLGQALNGQRNGMVLNFTFANWSPSCQSTRDFCIKAIAGHEFGHAIGFAHEQNRPDVPGECREPKQGPNGDTLLTPYDPHSIMNYCNAKYNNNGQLSSLDINAVQQLYGSR